MAKSFQIAFKIKFHLFLKKKIDPIISGLYFYYYVHNIINEARRRVRFEVKT